MFRNKTFSAINVSGLIMGITGALFLFLWISYEFSFDQFHSKKDQLYIGWNRATENGKVNCWSTTPRVLAPTLEKEYASVQNAVSYAKWDVTHLLTAGNTKLLKTSGVFTDPAFLTMLSFPLIKGDPATALSNPNSIVLTENLAHQLFGDREAFGEMITIGQSGYNFQFTVTGILKDLPTNTEFNFEYLISFQFLEGIGEKDTFWGNNSVTTVVKLNEGTDINLANDQIKNVEKKHFADGQHIEIFLYPLTKMRLYSGFENGVVTGGRIETMRMLGFLGACLLVIACINFVNLSTARSQRRSKEVAVRKISGAFRLALISQFLCESVLIAIIAGAISIAACYLLLPAFNTLVGQYISLDLTNVTFWAWFLALILLVGLLAGSYPSFYLSSFLPIRILKGGNIKVVGRNVLRSALVIFQFGFAVTLIACAIVIRRQIEFVQKRDAGYSHDNLIYMPLTGSLSQNFQSFKNELIQQELAVSLTKASAPITEQWSNTTEMEWRGKNPHENSTIERIFLDESISSTLGITVLQGRDMDLQRFASDSTAVLLNETALKIMDFKNPIGEIIIDNGREWHVIGIVKDFVFTSPFRQVEPIALFGCQAKWALNVLYLKLNGSPDLQQTLSKLSNLSKKYNPEYPFEYHFADAEYERKFDNLKTTLKITDLFTGITVFIACLGLLGLAIYTADARLKEIGIRKVMGGSVYSITKLLSLSSLKPVCIAVVLFTPVACIAMTWWLQSFAYRTNLDVWVFLTAACLILLISLITIATQTIKAAGTNPVATLRNE